MLHRCPAYLYERVFWLTPEPVLFENPGFRGLSVINRRLGSAATASTAR